MESVNSSLKVTVVRRRKKGKSGAPSSFLSRPLKRRIKHIRYREAEEHDALGGLG